MIVTNSEQQKRDTRRVNVYLNGAFAFGLHKETLARFAIRQGDTLTDETVRTIQSTEELHLAKQKALRYLSYRMRTEKEIRTKLTEQEFMPGTIDAVITQLKELRLIDDGEFARTFIRDTRLRKPSGRRLISQRLRLLGVSPALIQEALDEGLPEEDLAEAARSVAAKVLRRQAKARPG